MKYIRLNAIINMVDKTMNCADIGADHGYVTIKLANKFTANKFIAVENKKGPFNILKNNVKNNSLNNVICSLSDGLNAVNSDFNTIILAGMGGLNIINIIKKNIKKIGYIDNFIIDAHTDIPNVVRFMNGIGYKIEKYEIIEENKKNYIIFLFKKSSKKLIYCNSYYLRFSNKKTLSSGSVVILSDENKINHLKHNDTFIKLIN